MRRAVACLLAVVGLAAAAPAHAFLLMPDRGSLPSDIKLINRVHADEASIALSRGPEDVAYRDAVRDEQRIVYELGADAQLESIVLARLPASLAPSVSDSIEALRALYQLAEIDPSLMRPRFNRLLNTPASLTDLHGYYQGAGRAYAVDWTYLAAINFIESDFGRVLGPSSAGALGPMQFMPATWVGYGEGGDVMSPHDSIYAAAHYLVNNGAPGDMPNAIWHYNHDWSYVAAVSLYADAIRQNPEWLNRLYIWSTQEPSAQ
jgi:hypothetical protein